MTELTQEGNEYTSAELMIELNTRINQGDFNAAHNLYNQIMFIKKDGKTYRNMNAINTKLAILGIAFQIYEQEKQEKISTIFDLFPSWDRIIEHYYRLKFLLRRLEFELREEEQEEIVSYVINYNITFCQLFTIIQYSIVHKVKVLNRLAMLFFHNGAYDKVVPFLSEAYEIEPENEDTNYNLAYVLYHLGEIEMAREYITAVRYRTQRVEALADQILNKLHDKGVNNGSL